MSVFLCLHSCKKFSLSFCFKILFLSGRKRHISLLKLTRRKTSVYERHLDLWTMLMAVPLIPIVKQRKKPQRQKKWQQKNMRMQILHKNICIECYLGVFYDHFILNRKFVEKISKRYADIFN